MSKAREEQQRNSSRLTRQLLGAVAMALIVIGLFTVVSWIVGAVRAAFDDSGERLDYEQKLYGLVQFDVLPFEDVAEVDPAVFKQAAIWSVLYQTQQRDGSLDAFERDELTGAIILPQLEIETYLKNLFGPDYEVEHGAFETSNLIYDYSEERQGYLVPVIGLAGMYNPEVESIHNRGGRRYVTVGYIPTAYSGSEMMFGVPTEPTKFMEYVFTRGENRQWYMTALEESDRQPTATPMPDTDGLDSGLTGLPGDMNGVMPDAGMDAGSYVAEPLPEDGTEPAPEDGGEGTDGGEQAAEGENGADSTETNAESQE